MNILGTSQYCSNQSFFTIHDYFEIQNRPNDDLLGHCKYEKPSLFSSKNGTILVTPRVLHGILLSFTIGWSICLFIPHPIEKSIHTLISIAAASRSRSRFLLWLAPQPPPTPGILLLPKYSTDFLITSW